MTTRAPRLVAALLLVSLVLAACGGDDDEPGAVSTTTSTTTTEDEETDGSTTTTGDEETVESTTTTEADGGTFDEGSLESVGFCELDQIGDESDAFLVLFDPASTPEQVAEASSFVEALYARINAAAPPAIAGDVATLVEGAQAYLATLAEYDYDSAAVQAAAQTDPALAATVAGFEDPAFLAASDNVDAWIEGNCPAAE